jgi:serine/threonine protein kinase
MQPKRARGWCCYRLAWAASGHCDNMNPRESEFEKTKKLGVGSFGTVWLVRRRKDGAQFALKEISLRKPGLQQVMKEVETMMKLPLHRNIVRLYDHWMSADGEDMWLLLEYCSGGDLTQFFYLSDRLSDSALLDLCGQLLQALCVFEQYRILHNDIKHDNIFIMAGSVPKIGDLGLARFTSVGSVASKLPGGTPVYESPEVLSRQRGADGRPLFFPEYAACEISYQSDVYSLGVVMWSLCMRRPPDHPGCATPLTPALVPDAKLRELLNDMLQPNPALRHRASHLLLRLVSGDGRSCFACDWQCSSFAHADAAGDAAAIPSCSFRSYRRPQPRPL